MPLTQRIIKRPTISYLNLAHTQTVETMDNIMRFSGRARMLVIAIVAVSFYASDVRGKPMTFPPPSLMNFTALAELKSKYNFYPS